MDIFLILIGFTLVFLGLVGSFVPIIPGPISAWLGLLVLYQTSFLALDFYFLGTTLIIALGVFLLDYFIPMIGAKKFGGTKAGATGATLGLLIGVLFMGPIGIFAGPFIGALFGELIRDFSDKKTALKAAMGSLIGFLTGVFLKFSVTLVYAIYFVKILWNHRSII
tara:strand:+ start:3674 stop:4171 length:498 start_codon:yes stop_codon:yes gene_type:complete